MRERNGSGQLVEFCLGDARRNGLERGSVRPGDEQAVAGGDDALGDGRNLIWRLSRAKDDLGTPLPQRAMVVDAGEPQVLERRLA